jgi:hypothetical protein
MNSENIIYFLKLLNFVKPGEFSTVQLHEAINYLNNQQSIPAVVAPKNDCIIERCDNETIKIGIVRNASGIVQNENNLIYNKKKYKFDNVYDGANQQEEIVGNMLNFIEKRVRLGKDSSVITHGMSKSGKTTLINNLCSLLDLKVERESETSYKFQTDDILSVMERFATKSNNGLNMNSSRSHIILTIYYNNCCIRLFDVAGCEKMMNDNNKDETKYINSSLFNLSRFLQDPLKFKANKCILTSYLKKALNIIFVMMLSDNTLSKAYTSLISFSSILK